MEINKKIKWDLDDIVLIPSEQSEISSRSECEVESIFDYANGHTHTLPLIASPMDTVVCSKNIKKFIKNEIIPCMPREQYTSQLNNDKYFQSFGLNEIEDQLTRLDNITVNSDVVHNPFYDYKNILIDMANAHMSKLIPIIKKIKENCPDINLMVGNIANPETFVNLAWAGADYIRLSVGTGAGCFIENTQIKTLNNIKNIQDINIGDKVLTHKGNYKEVINKISYVENNDLVEINKKNVSTREHEYYVLKKIYTDIVNDENIEKYAEWIEAEKINNEYWLLEHNS